MPLAYERPRQSRGILGYVPPSQGDGPYGGQPLSRQGGQLTDYGAGQMNRASRDYLGQNYMPRTTVGGAYGQSPNMDYAASQGYAAGQHNRTQGSAAAPTRMRAAASGYGILGAVNHSSYGATSGTVIDSTGRPRPGWVDNYSGSTGAVGQADVQRGLDAVYNQGGRVVSPNGRMSLSPGSEQYDATQRAGEVFDARRGGLQARIADYEARTADAKQFREGNRIARGMQRGQRMTDSLDMRRGNLSMDERFMFGNPGPYAQMQRQDGILGLQRDIADQQSGDRRYVADKNAEASQFNAWNARYQQAIKDGNTPDDAARLAGPPPAAPPPQQGRGLAGATTGQGGGGNTPQANQGYRPKKQLLDAQLQQLAQLPKEQRAAALRGMGVSDTGDLDYYQSQIEPNYNYNPPGLLGNIANSPVGRYVGGGIGDFISNNRFTGQLDPYGGIAGLLGIRPPPLVRPAKPRK